MREVIDVLSLLLLLAIVGFGAYMAGGALSALRETWRRGER
jgi:hypothetical protein